MTLDTLITRIESLEGPDRETFCAAWNILFPKPDQIWASREPELWTREYAAWIERQHEFELFLEAHAWMDAAMTLVPEGDEWEISTIYNVARATVGLNCDHGGAHGEHLGANPVLAFLAAALKARAALSQPSTPPKVEADTLMVVRNVLYRSGMAGTGRDVDETADEIVAALTAKASATCDEPLREAVSGIDDDFMTSEVHHPGYVLIPTAKFDRIRAALATPSEAQTFQERVAKWLHECFGDAKALDARERLWRFIEEALELAQALDMSADDVTVVRDYVYGRAKGEPGQEVGGVMNTLAALCYATGMDMMAEGEREVARINRPEIIVKIRAKQKAKDAAGLYTSPLPGIVDEAQTNLHETQSAAGDGE